MTSLHIAGFPVEELLIVALVSAAPLLALVAMEVTDRVRRFRRAVRRVVNRGSP
jgi:hypothetical protein